jgi:cytochrome c peroxidase
MDGIIPLRPLHGSMGSKGLLMLLLFVCGVSQAQGLSIPATPTIPSQSEPITPVPPPPASDPRIVELGRYLFNDPQLSRNKQRSCASCHDLKTNGAGRQPQDDALDGSRLPFNTPSVFNAALNFRLGWVGNDRTLEAQTERTLIDPGIMDMPIEAALAVLRTESGLPERFQQIYGRQPDRENLLDAIATYERSLVTPASPFDLWLSGDATALSTDARSGYQLFKSLGCVSCHQGVNIGGNLFEWSGVYHRLGTDQPELFRVPSLRNVAVTAPYFHDGSAPTLENAVSKMGRAQLNRTLSPREIDLIVVFLKTLTGVYQGHVLTPYP